MEAKEILKKVKIMLGMEPDPNAPAPAPEAPAMTDYKLKDGSVVSCDKLEVGGKVMVNGAPATDGELVLEDGRTLVVAAGEIKEVKDAPAPAADPAAEQFEAVKKELSEVKTQFAAVQAENKDLKEKSEKLQSSVKEMVLAMEEVLKPVAEPIEQPEHFRNSKKKDDTPQKKWEEMTPLEQYRANKKEFQK